MVGVDVPRCRDAQPRANVCDPVGVGVWWGIHMDKGVSNPLLQEVILGCPRIVHFSDQKSHINNQQSSIKPSYDTHRLDL